MAEHEEDHPYHAKDAIGQAIKATLITGGAGLFISTIQNTLTRQNVGMMGVFTRTGGTVAVFAAMGGAYSFTSAASANLRQKDDTWNAAVGGLFSGTMLGLRFRSAPAVLGYGSAMAVVLSAFQFTGGRLDGYKRDPEIDEVARKEHMRKNRRRPIDETVHQLGEGRGIYGPGYPERRAQRIKEAYGIDVPGARTE
ncbi:probable NADH-ubiquinone oxidoreductase 213 kDa subunit [Ramularia collo-cygni]|uniref:Probable NADH-ubiquinone oxidoreductase 213 kDa subunit n=1 Tax=Ramularia collo-cygni TaxID=112498 RepID=A0A2D3VCI4_9PEZI|nr:probable NADH-ubiquinone oxidoreductase 213 kDa subunit [Ramularia collo-cygni]CZT23415.1 probable NADH-ubiquinone oxidoreductase 213 kDa subunit [Ramularia collo-cygni]